MATLSEVAQWVAGIYQIELTDPVRGGAPNEATGDGLTNIPAQQLAKRTLWLKTLLEDAGIAQETAALVTNFDSLTAAGFYRGAPAAVGAPDSTASHAVLHIPGNTTNAAFQLAMRIGASDRIYFRRKNSGVWASWVEITTAATLGTMATQDANAVAISGGTISGITDLAIADGGTGASTATAARSNLGLGAVATADVVPVANGGTGATTASAARSALGLGAVATDDTVPVARGGTGATTVSAARTALGLGAVATDDVVPVARGGTGATTASGALSNLGLTATATEINRLSGVTSSVQTQLDGKVPAARTVSAGLGLSGGGALSANISLALDLGELDAVDAGAMTNPRFVVIDGINGATQGRCTATQLRNAASLYSQSEVDALVTPSAIGAVIAQTALGAVGSYAFLRRSASDTAILKGASIAGSSLRYAGVIDSDSDYKAELELADNTAPSGTWRAMGSVGSRTTQYSATLFLRIA